MVRSNECHICFENLGRARIGVRQLCDHPYHVKCLDKYAALKPEWQRTCFYCGATDQPSLSSSPVDHPAITPSSLLPWIHACLLLALFGAMMALQDTSRSQCHQLHQTLIREASCTECFHELLLLEARRDDIVHCNGVDFSHPEDAKALYDDAVAIRIYDGHRAKCVQCVRERTIQARDTVSLCHQNAVQLPGSFVIMATLLLFLAYLIQST